MTTVDLVVAVCNEDGVIPAFVESVRALQLPASVEIGILFVEDSSTDKTVEVLRDVARRDRGVRYFSLEKGYGQAPALWFGMSRSEADAVITMDVDQGHPVPLIPSMLHRHLDGADVVQGVRAEIGGRAVYRDMGTRCFEWGVRHLTGIDLRRQNVHYRLVSKAVKERILANRRWIYFLRIDLRGSASRTDYVTFESKERAVGTSKYGFSRLLRHSLNGVLSIIPPKRFWILTGSLLVLSALLGMTIHPAAGAVLLAVALIVLVRYQWMCHNPIPERMTVKEVGWK